MPKRPAELYLFERTFRFLVLNLRAAGNLAHLSSTTLSTSRLLPIERALLNVLLVAFEPVFESPETGMVLMAGPVCWATYY